ncbi:MAG TPA: EAL domain-containing protein [Acidimicrobiales bacterium]|nr:EAL domain-containing protein [Acidimicrobiales bacterium]
MGDRVVNLSVRRRSLAWGPGLARSATPDRRLQYLLDISRDAFVETDGEFVVTEWNRQAERLFGWGRDEACGRRTTDFLVPEHFVGRYKQHLRSLERSLTDVQQAPMHTMTFLRADGREVVVSGTLYMAGTGDEVRIGGFLVEQSNEQDAVGAHDLLHDSLTGLPNRTLFNYRLGYALGNVNERNTAGNVAVAVLDLDRFKTINDGLSHDVGDEVLVATARRLGEADSDAQIIARLGGDEFLILFEGDGAERDAVAFADRALRLISEPVVAGDREVFVSASVGIACTSESVADAATLISNADAAMYQAKERGGGAIEVSGEVIRTRVSDRMNLEQALHRALERGELVLHYQPVIDLSSGRAAGVEALLRWIHPMWGMVSPDGFISVAEESGLIVPIGAWVLRSACRQMQEWQLDRRSRSFDRVAVNLSVKQLDRPDIVETVECVLDETGVRPWALTLEITESALMRDVDAALRALHAFRALGVNIAVDDFGTGYSSLSHLHRFPLDILKLDKTFIDGMARGNDGVEIVAAVIKLAHALKIQVVAEGVEQESQLELLRSMGCDLAQGYVFSAPVAAAEVIAGCFTERSA